MSTTAAGAAAVVGDRHLWKQLDPPKRKLVSSEDGILKDKNVNVNVSDGVQNGVKRRKQDVTSGASTVITITSSKKVGTIYKKGDLVNERYRILQLLGTGTFGEVYRVVDELQRNQELALKVEKPGKNHGLLRIEAQVYDQIEGGIGIPRVRLFSYDKKTRYPILLLESLGPSLQDMLTKCGGKFSLETTAMLADQMIERVEYLHGRNLIHRDIKPENFLLGRKGPPTKDSVPSIWKRLCGEELYLIDYGLAKRFRDAEHKHIPPACNGGGVTGTVRYTSIPSHLGEELSRRDDLESIAYILVYFAKGKLPWQNMTAPNKQAKHAKICDIKMQTPAAELCRDLPIQFTKCVDYCRNLGFDEVPDYAFLRSLFRKLIADSTKKGTGLVYDWNVIP